MLLKECLEHVLQNYLQATHESFEQHHLAKFIRREFRDAVALVIRDTDRLIVKGSAGQGVWARGPWVGIFDPIITTSAQSGYYPVYLFREDMLGVYLSLIQGMTEAKALYKADAKTALRARAANFRAMLGSQVALYPEQTIDLAPSTPSNDTAFYEAGRNLAAPGTRHDD
jgi:5-methylcytosine-specific restriction protein A